MTNNEKLIGAMFTAGVILYLLSQYTTTGQAIVQQISQAGLDLIAQFEGFSATSYNDPPGSDLWSIGYGHQIQPGETFDEPISVAEGQALLAQDTANAQAAVTSLITVPLTSAQFDALTSFVYNVGVGAFKAGTVPAKLNAGDFAAAADTMRKYTLAGGVVSAALVERRDVEASAFA